MSHPPLRLLRIYINGSLLPALPAPQPLSVQSPGGGAPPASGRGWTTGRKVALVVTLALLFGGLVALVINYRGHPVATGGWRGAGKRCRGVGSLAPCATGGWPAPPRRSSSLQPRPPCQAGMCWNGQMLAAPWWRFCGSSAPLPALPAVVDPEAGVEPLPLKPKEQPAAADKQQGAGGGKQQAQPGPGEGGGAKNATQPAGKHLPAFLLRRQGRLPAPLAAWAGCASAGLSPLG